ncbi:hypothetical protein BaRGS_00030720, partial [Batillaria attramentaria]
TTDLTEVDRKDIREAFDILDEDGDGKLSTAELETLLRGQFVVASNKELKELLENMDVDKNGTVDYEEFEDFVKRNGLYKASMEEVSEDMRDAFQVFDKDGDGYIDVEEFKTVMMTMGDKMSEEEVQKMMKDADANGDGKIDYKGANKTECRLQQRCVSYLGACSEVRLFRCSEEAAGDFNMIVAQAFVFVVVAVASTEAAPIRQFIPGPPGQQEKPLDTLDKLYARLDDAIDQLKTAGELVGNIETHLSLLKKFVDDFLLITLPEVESINNSQNLTLDKLWEH